MKQHISVLFLIRKSRLSKTGEASISMRLTVSGQFVEINTYRKVLPAHWNQKKEQVTGKSPLAVEINSYLNYLRAKVFEFQKDLELSNEFYNAVTLKEMLLSGKGKTKMFFEAFQEHIDRITKLIGIDYVDKTVQRYERCLKYFKEMYSMKSKDKDFPFEKLTESLLNDFEFFLKVNKQISHNTTVHYLKCVKKIIKNGIANAWIKHDPAINIHCQEKEVHIDFLLMDELDTLRNKEFKIKRLEQVRDVYLFCCFTGLAYVDVDKLQERDFAKDGQGNLWIRKTRNKTNVMCDIPLLEIPLAILEKYKSDPECQRKGKLLPVISNQRMNSYLKEIADLCAISKKMTTHTARHTFATTVTLANNVSIENVSKMLGHTNIRTTQHYAKVLNSSIMDAMKYVGEVFLDKVS